MIAAAGTAEEGLAILLFIIVGSLIIWIIAAARGPAQYDIRYKGGAPYCPRCNRQVSLRREYCRCCGYAFVTYRSQSNHAPQPNQNTDPLPDQQLVDLSEIAGRFFQGILTKLSKLGINILRILKFILSLQWVSTLPEWAQPIVWGLIVPIPPVIIFLVFRAIVLCH